MTTTQITYFLEICRQQSFTKAADTLYVSQPALSRQIHALEQELGAKLFERSGNTIRLTSAGAVFKDGVEPIRRQLQFLMEQVELTGCGGQRLSIGVLEEQRMDPAVLDTLNSFYVYQPEVKISIVKDSFSGLMTRLSERTIDLAVTMTFMLEGRRNLRWLGIRQNRLNLAVPVHLPLARRESISLAEFPELVSDTPFILVNPSDAEPANIQQLRDLKEAGFFPKEIKYAPSEGLMALWVASGMGVGIMSDNHVLARDRSVRFLPITGLPQTTTAIVWQKNNENESLMRFVDQMKKNAPQHMGAE